MTGDRSDGEAHLGLMVAACPDNPGRVGEIALLPEGQLFVLGRGDEAGNRMTFGRLRPGLWEPSGPWTLRQMSRRQLSVWAESGSLRIEQLGRGELRVAGQATMVGRARAGDLVTIDRHLLLVCVERTSTLPIPKLFPRALIPEYGGADAGGFVGESPQAWRLRESAALAAAQSNPIAVIAAPGFGKRVLAQLIQALRQHQAAEPPFVSWAAGSVPDEHALASLLGDARHPGVLAQATEGTLWISHAEKLNEQCTAALVAWLSSQGGFTPSGAAQQKRSGARLLLTLTADPPAHVSGLLERVPVIITADRQVDPGDRALVMQHLARALVGESEAALEAWCDASGDLRLPVAECESVLGSAHSGHQLRRALWSSLGGPPALERESSGGRAREVPGTWLARDHFDASVRDALRSFMDLHRLSASPLLGSRVVRGGGPFADPALAVRFLREHLVATAGRLPDPRDAELLQISYFAPRAKHIAVAAELGLAYSAYRRQLEQVVEHFCEQLWVSEVEAAP